MSTVPMTKEKLIQFIIIYCSATHISNKDKEEMLKETLDQFYDKIEELEKEIQPLKTRIQMLLEL